MQAILYCACWEQTLNENSPVQGAINRRLKDRVTRSLSNIRLRPSSRVTVAPVAGIDEQPTVDTAVSTGDVTQAVASLSLSNSTGSDVDVCHVFTTSLRSHSMLALNTDNSSWRTFRLFVHPYYTTLTHQRTVVVHLLLSHSVCVARHIGSAKPKILGGPNLRPTVHVLQNSTRSITSFRHNTINK